METIKSKAAKIIKLAEFLVIAEQKKKNTQQQGENDVSNFKRTIDVSTRLIYDILNEATCEEKDEIFYRISEYACALQNNMTSREMWWTQEPVLTIEGASPSITLDACNIIRPLYDELCQKNQTSATTDPAM